MNMGKLIASGAICCFLLAGCVTSTTTGDLERQPNNDDAAKLNYSLGVKYYDAGSYELARDRLIQATEIDPRFAEAHATLGRTYLALENPRLARIHYEKSVSIAPRNFNIRNAYAVFLCEQRDYDGAAEQFDRAIEHPENDNAEITMTNAGMCMLQQPDNAKAEAYFRAALDAKANYGDALLQLCLMKYLEKDYLGARAFVERYISSNVSTAGVLYLAARIEDMLGNDKGRTDYENELLRSFPNSEEARRILGSG